MLHVCVYTQVDGFIFPSAGSRDFLQLVEKKPRFDINPGDNEIRHSSGGSVDPVISPVQQLLCRVVGITQSEKCT